jgi:hypothetical protein
MRCQVAIHVAPHPDQGWFFTVRGSGRLDGVYSNGGRPYPSRVECERVLRKWLARQGFTVESLTVASLSPQDFVAPTTGEK